MRANIRLGEVLPSRILETHHEHISDFLEQEAIGFDLDDLAAAEMDERKVKELMGELAGDVED